MFGLNAHRSGGSYGAGGDVEEFSDYCMVSRRLDVHLRAEDLVLRVADDNPARAFAVDG